MNSNEYAIYVMNLNMMNLCMYMYCTYIYMVMIHVFHSCTICSVLKRKIVCYLMKPSYSHYFSFVWVKNALQTVHVHQGPVVQNAIKLTAL